ncbi:hypothetical protein HNY73_005078 [Argiope bruennichi]|uniref:Uncharacterized protein n=1 Tax=Argiope bruennichi TaxID=94029 RepID=A0A8T0FIF1_ARGBR|nr:hypothetical protein HNY73_005078 [Argiope bruennichi]
MADSGNGEFLALLAEMKKSMEAGQERLEKEMHSGQERMDEMKQGQENLLQEMKAGQEKLLQEMEAFTEEMKTLYEDMKNDLKMSSSSDEVSSIETHADLSVVDNSIPSTFKQHKRVVNQTTLFHQSEAMKVSIEDSDEDPNFRLVHKNPLKVRLEDISKICCATPCRMSLFFLLCS